MQSNYKQTLVGCLIFIAKSGFQLHHNHVVAICLRYQLTTMKTFVVILSMVVFNNRNHCEYMTMIFALLKTTLQQALAAKTD